jgi:PAT family beta-lactamase induction signal transducer AmpG
MESIYRLVRTKKMVLAMQLVISIAFLLVGLTIPMNNFFVISLAIFFGSRLIQMSDFYMLALEKEQQSFFLGIRSTFYLSMLTGNGLIVIIGGFWNRNMEINRKRGPTIIVGLLWLP